jgi:ring-1,2-phenylacetyl-CoA epoxidase subunit PaaC
MEKNKDFLDYILHLADTQLILAQRLSEWCGHGPVLEQDIAIANMALDVLGQASYLYEYAAELLGNGKTADDLAMLRSEREFKNLLVVELPNGDFGQTVARQFFFDAYFILILAELTKSPNSTLAAIAEKALKEAKYHFKWSSEWVIRLGDGTEESHQRMRNAVGELMPYLNELFIPAPYELTLLEKGLVPDARTLKAQWLSHVRSVLAEAQLDFPWEEAVVQQGGKVGIHTEYLGYILAEMQYLQRSYPGLQW